MRFLAIALLLAVSSAFQAPIASKASMAITMQHGGKGFGGGEVCTAHHRAKPLRAAFCFPSTSHLTTCDLPPGLSGNSRPGADCDRS